MSHEKEPVRRCHYIAQSYIANFSFNQEAELENRKNNPKYKPKYRTYCIKNILKQL
ncbi:hypothetical protein VQ643_02320 [Pseudomonas sp. F1_0610]|uniref:hypothetical protein n=1 Tax=Pseudomonas sp. F1_0610 TaxID=3114284 RepID=UPI0039C060F1